MPATDTRQGSDVPNLDSRAPESLNARQRRFVAEYALDHNATWASLFSVLENEAQVADRGIWGDNCGSAGGGSGDGDPSYPDFCIPPPPTRPRLWRHIAEELQSSPT